MKTSDKKIPALLVKVLLALTLVLGGSMAVGADYIKGSAGIGLQEALDGTRKEVMIVNPSTGQSLSTGMSYDSLSAGEVNSEVHGTRIEFELKNVSIGGLDIR